MKKAMPFKGKQTKAEEMAEAKAVRSGRVTPAQYARREKSEGDSSPPERLRAIGQKLATGKMSAAKYAAKPAKKER